MSNVFSWLIIFITLAAAVGFIFQEYRVEIINYFSGKEQETLFVSGLSMKVTIADDPTERQRGLSNVKSLNPNEGKLFIFEEEGDYGFWMKDMNFAIDIFWIDEDFTIVHIEENVRPESYPEIFSSPNKARFVLETNAFFARSWKIKVGDRVTLPAYHIPYDLQVR